VRNPHLVVLAIASAALLAGSIVAPIPAVAQDAAPLQVLPISTQHWIGENDVILQLFDAESRPLVERDVPLTLTLTAPDGTVRDPVVPRVDRWALSGRDLYVARVTFDQLGSWSAVVRVERNGETLEGSTELWVQPDDGTPPLGAPVPDVDTPTLLDAGNLTDAISSDPETVAAFYWTSVTDALRDGQPFVFILDSYAYRPNEACGGALGIIHDIFIEYPRLKVIHAEPWLMRFAGGQLTLEPPEGPPTLAPWSVAYGVMQPPWVFVVDGDGNLRAKLTGVFGTDELRAAMTAVGGWRPLAAPAATVPPAADAG
jgi:hypothetical protein